MVLKPRLFLIPISESVRREIAIVGLTGHGVWSYSLDGTTFTAIGTESTSSALLLPIAAELRYTPDAMNGEAASITYRAWDCTYGTPGTTVDATVGGGNTAFSAAADTASVTVTDLNDAPVLTPVSPSMGATTKDDSITIGLGSFINNGATTTTIIDVDHGAAVGGIAIVGTTGLGVWTYSLDGVNFRAIGETSAASALLLPATAMLRYAPDQISSEKATITYHAWDMTSGASEGRIDVTDVGGTTAFSLLADTSSLAVNDAPQLTPASPLIGSTDENTPITLGPVGIIHQ